MEIGTRKFPMPDDENDIKKKDKEEDFVMTGIPINQQQRVVSVL